MIDVLITPENISAPFRYSKGVHAVPDENGWISILDEDGLTLGMHHKDHVIAVLIKAGEIKMSENPG